MNSITFDLWKISPLICLFISSLIPLTVKLFRKNVEPHVSFTLLWSLIGIVGAIFLLLIFGRESTPSFNEMILFDNYTVISGSIALFSCFIAIAFSIDSFSTAKGQFSETIFLILSTAIGLLFILAARDLLAIFIGLEMMSLPLYLLIAISNEQKYSKEAAFKYFVLGSFASAILLFGIALLFGTTGSTHLSEISRVLTDKLFADRLFFIGVLLVITGFSFKISLVPFHAWTTDVYHGAPTWITSYMSTAVKAVSLIAFIRFLSTNLLVQSSTLINILQWLAVATMLVGSFGAIIQTNVKRMLAFSSISHSGYLLIGLICYGLSSNDILSNNSILFYLLGYTITTLGAFGLVNYIERNENHQVSLEDLSGLSVRKPLIAVFMTIFMLSLAGIPPTVGFFGKFYLLTAALSQGLTWLTVWALISSAISVYFYLRIIVYMYMKESTDSSIITKSSVLTQVILFVLAGLVIVFGLTSGLVVEQISFKFI
jgi:NADH-quinone oxidoreductase subunit N